MEDLKLNDYANEIAHKKTNMEMEMQMGMEKKITFLNGKLKSVYLILNLSF